MELEENGLGKSGEKSSHIESSKIEQGAVFLPTVSSHQLCWFAQRSPVLTRYQNYQENSHQMYSVRILDGNCEVFHFKQVEQKYPEAQPVFNLILLPLTISDLTYLNVFKYPLFLFQSRKNTKI